MERQLTKGDNLRLVEYRPDSIRAKTKIIRKGSFTDLAVAQLKQQREQSKQTIAKSLALESKLDELEKLISELTQQHLVCTGNIERKSVWQRAVRLNDPLTQEERNLIRRIKSKCQPIPVKKSEIAGI